MDARLTPGKTVLGILYPGDLGAALAGTLQTAGYDVVTTLDGRTSRTNAICRRAGVRVLAQLKDVVQDSDVILSTVTPAAALTVAAQVQQEAGRLNRQLIYIDANSTSPQTTATMTQLFSGSRVRMVDAAIHGLADRLATHGTIYASGLAASVVAELFEPQIRVRLLGDEPGNASLMKMSLGGMAKGMIGLFLQSSRLAHRANMVEEFSDELGRYYPDVLGFIERSLPTYPQHAERRAEEMRELEETLQAAGQPTGIAAELSHVFSRIASSNLAMKSGAEKHPTSIQRLIALIDETQSAVETANPDTPLLCT